MGQRVRREIQSDPFAETHGAAADHGNRSSLWLSPCLLDCSMVASQVRAQLSTKSVHLPIRQLSSMKGVSAASVLIASFLRLVLRIRRIGLQRCLGICDRRRRSSSLKRLAAAAARRVGADLPPRSAERPQLCDVTWLQLVALGAMSKAATPSPCGQEYAAGSS